MFLHFQSAQMTHILGERLTKLAEDAKREKALKDVANDNTKEKSKATKAAKKKAQSLEKARQAAEKGKAKAKNRLESEIGRRRVGKEC